jgi:hypothetical protein
MATVKQIVGARTSLTLTGFATLASATYAVSAAYDCTTNDPIDMVVEIDVATTNTPTGNKQLVVYLQESLDGTNFRSGPTSGTTTTNEPNLLFLGAIPMNAASTTQIATYSIMQALGYVPYAFKIVVKNDMGVALTGGNAYTSEISETIT